MFQVDTWPIVGKVRAMKYGAWLILPAILFAALTVLVYLLFMAHSIIISNATGSVGIPGLLWVTQQSWFGALALLDLVIVVVLWVSVLLLSLKGAAERPVPGAETTSIGLAITSHTFGYRTNTGTYYKTEPSVEFTLALEFSVVFEVWPQMAIEMVELEIAGRRFSPDKWTPEPMVSHATVEVTFVIPHSISGGQHGVRLFALANNQWWQSAEYTLTLPSSPWWR